MCKENYINNGGKFIWENLNLIKQKKGICIFFKFNRWKNSVLLRIRDKTYTHTHTHTLKQFSLKIQMKMEKPVN